MFFNFVDELRSAGAPLAAVRNNRFDVRARGELGAANLDWVRLRHAVVQLVDNAAKFTEAGQIEVEVSRERRLKGEVLSVRVRDNGPGIAPEQLAHIFEPLAQGDESSVRRHQGAGLGLAQARLIARLLGGDVECDSDLGRGATFTLWAPIG